MVVRNREVSIPLMRREVGLGLRDLERFSSDLLNYQQQVQEILQIPKFTYVAGRCATLLLCMIATIHACHAQ
jgi:hypothetical protein